MQRDLFTMEAHVHVLFSLTLTTLHKLVSDVLPTALHVTAADVLPASLGSISPTMAPVLNVWWIVFYVPTQLSVTCVVQVYTLILNLLNVQHCLMESVLSSNPTLVRK